MSEKISSLKKLIIISVSLLGVVVLINLFGYYYINVKTVQNKHREAGEKIAASQQVVIEQVAGSFYILSTHHFPPKHYDQQIFKLRQLLAKLDYDHATLKNLVTNNMLPSDVHMKEIREAFAQASMSYSNVKIKYDWLLKNPTETFADKHTSHNQLPGNETEYMSAMQQMVQTYKDVEKEVKNGVNSINTIIISSLIIALLGLVFLGIAPVLRQSLQNYNDLQSSLIEIQKSESLLRTIIDSSPDFIYIKDEQHRFTMVNKAMAEEVNRTPEYFIGKTELDFGVTGEIVLGNPSKGIKGVQHHNEEVFANGKTVHLRQEEIYINGKMKIVSTTKAPLRNSDGAIWGMLGFVHDITDGVTAERKIQDSEKKYRYLFHDNPMPMWILDLESLRFLEVNQMATKHYGYSAEEFATMTIQDLRPEKDKKSLQKVTEQEENNTFEQGQWTHYNKNGEKIFVEIISHKINYNNRAAMLVLANDVTANVHLQKELLEQKVNHQREKAKAAIVVQEKQRSEIGRDLHDNVNQILTAAKLQFECMDYTNEKMRNNGIKMLSTAINEIRRLSKSLVPPSLDDVGLIQSIQDLMENVNMTQTKFKFYHPGFNEELFDPGLKLTIFRIIQEQATNILKYAEAPSATIKLSQKKEHLLLSISDTGKGFDLSRPRKGIGLTNIINRADMYNGKVDMESLSGKGFCINIKFNVKQAS